MTNDEFAKWLDHHCAAYPGVRKWLAGNDGQVTFWMSILRDTSLLDAMSATNQLVASDDQPGGYGEHPRIVRRIASASQPRDTTYTSRHEPRYSCHRCIDTGIVSVLSPATLDALRQDNREHGLRRCALACDCVAGDKYAEPTESRHSRPLARWSDGHCLIDERDTWDQDDAWQSARETIQRLDTERLVLPEFADYAPQTQQEL